MRLTVMMLLTTLRPRPSPGHSTYFPLISDGPVEPLAEVATVVSQFKQSTDVFLSFAEITGLSWSMLANRKTEEVTGVLDSMELAVDAKSELKIRESE